MVSLVIYILSFSIIIGIIGAITVFFSNNMRDMNKTAGSSSEYNKFNLYMLEYTKNCYEFNYGTEIIDENGENKLNENDRYLTFFKNDAEEVTFVKLGDILYFNHIKLCENVDKFEVKESTAENGKAVLETYIQINGTAYTTDYVIE